jgi:hypothetical protein
VVLLNALLFRIELFGRQVVHRSGDRPIPHLQSNNVRVGDAVWGQAVTCGKHRRGGSALCAVRQGLLHGSAGMDTTWARTADDRSVLDDKTVQAIDKADAGL